MKKEYVISGLLVLMATCTILTLLILTGCSNDPVTTIKHGVIKSVDNHGFRITVDNKSYVNLFKDNVVVGDTIIYRVNTYRNHASFTITHVNGVQMLKLDGLPR